MLIISRVQKAAVFCRESLPPVKVVIQAAMVLDVSNTPSSDSAGTLIIYLRTELSSR